jgi:hypothetical protein
MAETLFMTTPTDSPIYCRAAVVAQTLGIPKKLLIDDIRNGRTPVAVRLAFFGKSRIAHLVTEDARALIQALPHCQKARP